MKKIIAIVVALAMVMALSLSVTAFAGSQDIVLVTQDNVSWQAPVSDPVTIDGPGEYTLTLSGLSFDGSAMTVLYIKDATAVAEGDAFTGTSNLSGFSVNTKSIKINGEAVELTEGYRHGLTDAGVFDIAWYNIWDVSYFETYNGTITDIEVVIEVIDADGAAAPADEPVGDGTAEDNNTVEPDTTTSSNEDTAPAPSTSTTTTAPNTGLALAVVPAVMALAAVAVSKKR